MAQKQTVRLKPKQLQDDQEVLAALADITDYKPANAAFTLDKVQSAGAAMQKKQDDETRKQAAASAARDASVAAEWDFHNLVLGAKDQVIAQYGRDSNEAQGVGLKKKSERQAPRRRAKTPAAEGTARAGA